MKPLLVGALSMGALLLGTLPAMAGENEEAMPLPGASTSLVTTSAAPNPASQPPLVEQLESLVKDLQMPSESDEPIRVFWFEQSVAEPTPADYARMAGLKLQGNEPIEMLSLSELLDQPATEQTWMGEDDKKTARRFAALRAFLNANFAEIEVLSFGTTEKQIVVAGRLENGFAGLVTLVVET